MNKPIDGEVIAIANCQDARVQQILTDIPVLADFVQRFTTPAGRRLRPGMMIMREDAPKTYFSVEAVSSFRDLVAMCVIPLSRANSAIHGRSFATYYSDWYEFYPWTINAIHQHIVCDTPALKALELVTDFRGQCDPGLSPVVLDERDFDNVLLKLLLKRWRNHYHRKSRKWADTALFRSLNMAVAASKMPATVDVRLFDLGRTVSLWVSAFEILAHPRIGKSGLHLVYHLLDQAPWHDKRLKQKRYRAYSPSKKTPAHLRSLPCWLYGEIYQARNDFLHGNPIRQNRLHVKGSGRSLFQYSPMLYRMALAAFLPIAINLKAPPATDTKAYSNYLKRYFEVFSDQRDIEAGIRTVRQKAKR
ncbi:MAG TPA: hypothetical protein VK430_00360 [Xanthobacteraceae bacterium]|nr:hypothetical protein [Xanthobacteraceae bacterium]